MLEKGVIIDPLANDIQPIVSNNAFLVKKNSTIPWDQCMVEDVQLVTAFDYLNKFIRHTREGNEVGNSVYIDCKLEVHGGG